MICIIRAFALHSYILSYHIILLAESAGPDQTARVRRLIRAFAVSTCLKKRHAPFAFCADQKFSNHCERNILSNLQVLMNSLQ